MMLLKRNSAFITIMTYLGMYLCKLYCKKQNTIDIIQYSSSPSQSYMYVPLLGIGLLSEREGLERNSHEGSVWIGYFTQRKVFLHTFLSP